MRKSRQFAGVNGDLAVEIAVCIRQLPGFAHSALAAMCWLRAARQWLHKAKTQADPPKEGFVYADDVSACVDDEFDEL